MAVMRVKIPAPSRLGLLPPCVLLSVVSSLAGQGPGWVFQSPPQSPINRSGHAMAHDATRQRITLFGGNNWGLLDDTWTFDGWTWTQRQPTIRPAPRTGHAMAFDQQRQRVVLFGGASASGVVGDTWEWNDADWLQVGIPGPAPRTQHAMTYDSARQRVVLFGGQLTGGNLANDTWEWNWQSWQQTIPSAIPQARSGHGLAYDPLRQRTVLFGGSLTSGVAGDTWEWDGNNWTPRVTPMFPPARTLHAMAFDAAAGSVLLVAGQGASGLLGDSWHYDGVDWRPVGAAVAPPRSGAALAHHVALRSPVLFGGFTPTTYLGDTSILGGTPALALPYGDGCGSPALTLQLAADARPVIGSLAAVLIPTPPSALVLLSAGLSRTTLGPFQLPLPLGGFGMPGCLLHHSAEAAGMTTTTVAGGQQLTAAVPMDPVLVGQSMFLQAYAYAPGANPLEVVISNGLHWRFGNL